MNRMTALLRRRPGRRPEKLGTFLGVFTPSILTILGVILYLRTGWVVGNVGLGGAILVVVVANAVTLATALSVVATNMRVGAGGAYYIISRSLGVEVGAAIGIPLFLAQAFSVTLYAFGLAESLRLIWPAVPLRPVAAITVLVVAFLAARGADVALRLQLPIMGWRRTRRRCDCRRGWPTPPGSGPCSPCSSPRSPGSWRGCRCRVIWNVPNGRSPGERSVRCWSGSSSTWAW